jgi:2-iminobutanoate/2-iminopropanoate deaminase
MQKSAIVCDKVVEPSGPYSCGTRIDFGETELIFVSGQVAEDVKGNTVGKGDIVRQTEQVLTNLQNVLAAAGASLADVVKVTVFLRNMEHRDTVAEVRQRFFKDHLSSSTLVEVNKLAHPDWLIEIEAVAVVPH